MAILHVSTSGGAEWAYDVSGKFDDNLMYTQTGTTVVLHKFIMLTVARNEIHEHNIIILRSSDNYPLLTQSFLNCDQDCDFLLPFTDLIFWTNVSSTIRHGS